MATAAPDHPARQAVHGNLGAQPRVGPAEKPADSMMTYQQNMKKWCSTQKKTISEPYIKNHQNDMIFLFKTTTQNIKDIWNIEKLQSTVYNGKLTTEFGEERSDSIDEKSRIQYDSVVKQESSDTWNSRAEPKSKPGFDRQKKTTCVIKPKIIKHMNIQYAISNNQDLTQKEQS